jgi:hypothetical protein
MSEERGFCTVRFDGKPSTLVNWSSLCVMKDCDQAITEDYPKDMPKDSVELKDANDAYGAFRARLKTKKMSFAMLMLSQNEKSFIICSD